MLIRAALNNKTSHSGLLKHSLICSVNTWHLYIPLYIRNEIYIIFDRVPGYGVLYALLIPADKQHINSRCN